MSDSLQTVLTAIHSGSEVLSEPKLDGDPDVIYFPSLIDEIWDNEMAHVTPFLKLPALDVCCGGRSPMRGMWRVDNDRANHPNILCDCNKLPFCDEVFESVYIGHGLEHLDNTRNAIKEFLRVLKRGGNILIVHPDLQYTAGLDSSHKYEYTEHDFRVWLVNNLDLGFDIKAVRPASPYWSFFVHLVKL